VGASPSLCAHVDAWDRGATACSGGATRASGLLGGAPVVVSSEERVGKLQGSVGKLGVGPIGVEKGRGRVLHGEQGAAAGGGRRQWCSGRNPMVFKGW
jgi:hypothetical protein